MQTRISLRLLPSEAASEQTVKTYIAQAAAVKTSAVSGYNIIQQSVDARRNVVYIHLSVEAFINEPHVPRKLLSFAFRQLPPRAKKVMIIGGGPAGLFAALQLIELGIKPIILERGKDVRARRRDLAVLNKQGIINPESNYCFGEGGAGTYSDGKLYTRSSKRGDITRILNLFVYFGAEENILYQTHPHIGTNKLPRIISAMREKIIDCGGEFWFHKKMTDFTVDKNGKIKTILASGEEFADFDAVILATGHSARDIFLLLQHKQILIESKPFALGVRIEHPQSVIDSAQYHCAFRGDFLPPASYSLVQQVQGRGVFSFCMCPGGIIAPAATNTNEVVVNGWSPSRRNNPFANSGIVVPVNAEDVTAFRQYGALAGMYFQKDVEEKAYVAGGGCFAAPAQRMEDFVNNKISGSLPDCSYLPGIRSANLQDVLPGYIYQNLQIAFREFGKKMKGYFTNEAVVVATESRTSSPVRIPRNPESLHHPQLTNLYPCGEGAGYAGGIVSAAMDGEKVARQIAQQLFH
jgi:uncharacterized FAD-dependent dehydrogenase